jgi:hypothetical protein
MEVKESIEDIILSGSQREKHYFRLYADQPENAINYTTIRDTSYSDNAI